MTRFLPFKDNEGGETSESTLQAHVSRQSSLSESNEVIIDVVLMLHIIHNNQYSPILNTVSLCRCGK
jgi:hypothetical protein